MRRALQISGLAVAALLVLYVTMFSIWWFRSRSEAITAQGRQLRIVHFRYSELYYRTQVIWIPAHFVVEHVFGYKPIALMAAESESVLQYAK